LNPFKTTNSSDPELLHRFFRDAFQTGDPADGQQGDVARHDAVALGGQGMAELMQHDAGE
jgi:hypothetical protein